MYHADTEGRERGAAQPLGMSVSMLAGMIDAMALVHMRVCVEHSVMSVRVAVIVALAPADQQPGGQKDDDESDRHLRTLKYTCGKLAREQQHWNPEDEQCHGVSQSPGQAEHSGPSRSFPAIGENQSGDRGQVIRIGCVPQAQQHRHDEG
jgi:hypothetical protein